jgi:phenylpyruvate tautomerase PptA (4-oxalocrotonate tautomerase family)
MPMIDVTAAAGKFPDKRELTKALTAAMIRWEKVPAISLFLDNTGAFVHEVEPDALATASGKSDCVRVQVLTPAGALDREQQLGVVKEITEIIASAAGDPGLAQRTWVLIAESPDGGWGVGGHAYTRAEIVAEAGRELAALRSSAVPADHV